MNKKIILSGLLFSFVIVPAIGAAATNCRQVSGKTYYTDGVEIFSDVNCRQEMNSVSSSTVTTTVPLSSANGSCRYNEARRQYSDGVSFFLDGKCTNEAFAGETVAAPNAVPATQLVALTSMQSAQLSSRIEILEKNVASLKVMLAQILALLAKK